ncbi:hypothetical protein LR48_Vigan03g084000 [Vigna angularis]|uniref:Uncharacterized protein n=1 Tax=Phaseolus angularis TaxID=3914 RepID=A0A0L9U3S6_PHAAN|nr:hypothetical protein LR48_Vigan03g084000 [Vigna angularis]
MADEEQSHHGSGDGDNVAAEGFAGMTGLNASVRRSTEAVWSTTTSVLQTNAQLRPFGQLLPRFCKQSRLFGLFTLYITVAARPFGRGLFSLYITVAAEGFTGMTRLNASVRRSTETVQSTTTSVMQTSEGVRSLQSVHYSGNEAIRSTTDISSLINEAYKMVKIAVLPLRFDMLRFF